MASLQSVLAAIQTEKKKNDVRREFTLGELTFSVGLISRDQEIMANEYASSYEGLTRILKLDVAILAYAIKALNDFEFEKTVDDPEEGLIESSIFLRKHILDMPSPIVDKLIVMYHDAKNELRRALGLTVLEFDNLIDAAKNSQKDLKDIPIPNVEELQELADQMVFEDGAL